LFLGELLLEHAEPGRGGRVVFERVEAIDVRRRTFELEIARAISVTRVTATVAVAVALAACAIAIVGVTDDASGGEQESQYDA